MTHQATLTFDLTSVDGESAFRDAIDGHKCKYALQLMSDWFRNTVKHGELDSPQWDAVDKAKQAFYEIINDQNITIN